MLCLLSTDFQGTIFCIPLAVLYCILLTIPSLGSSKDPQPMLRVVKDARQVTEQLQASRYFGELDKAVEAQTAQMFDLAQFWSVIFWAILSFLHDYWLPSVVKSSVILTFPNPSTATQEIEKTLAIQSEIVALTDKTIKNLDLECRSAIQTHNNLRSILFEGHSQDAAIAVTQLDSVRSIRLDLDKEIARTVRETHALIHGDRQKSERDILESIRQTEEAVKSFREADKEKFYLSLVPIVHEKVEEQKKRTTDTQDDDPTVCGWCVVS